MLSRMDDALDPCAHTLNFKADCALVVILARLLGS